MSPVRQVRETHMADGASFAAPLRVGVIGVGRIGSMHARLLAGPVTGASLVAVSDVDAAAAGAVGRELGVPVASDPGELLADDEVDAVAICSSTDTHAALVAEVAAAGKPIFCEKPVSLDRDELERALEAVEGAGVPFQIGFNRRFDPAHASVREAVSEGSVGEPHLVRISSRDPEPPPLAYVRRSGGIFLDMTIHDFDMARFVTGSEVEEVYARGAVRIDPSFADAGDVDTAVVTLAHANGCLTLIDNSRRATYGYDQRVEVHGSRGMAASENPPAHSGVLRTAQGSHIPPHPTFFLERYVPSYVREWEAFAGAVRSGTRPAPSTSDARAPLLIGLAARRSLRDERPVAVEAA